MNETEEFWQGEIQRKTKKLDQMGLRHKVLK